MTSETVNISGGCHCGDIRYQLEWPVQSQQIPARACGCSYCTRFSATWTSHPEASIDVTFQSPDTATRYRFDTETAELIHCRSCGVLCLAICQIDGTDYAVVNINTFTTPEVLELDRSTSDFSGEETTDRLERRKQRWIGAVNCKIAH